MSVGVDFDFGRYIAMRRGTVEAQARDGSAYAYAGERKFRRTLAAAKPVTIALEATTRYWRDTARAELLGSAEKTSDQQFPKAFAAARRAGAALGVRVPPVYVSKKAGTGVQILGTEDAPYLVVGEAWLTSLSDDELTAVIGHQLAHIQNGHVLYATALYYLANSAALVVRWTVQPAIIALRAWQRRADYTCDRAALLAIRSTTTPLDTYVAALTKLGVGNDLKKRIAALQLFSQGAMFATLTGGDATGKTSTKEIDSKVSDL